MQDDKAHSEKANVQLNASLSKKNRSGSNEKKITAFRSRKRSPKNKIPEKLTFDDLEKIHYSKLNTGLDVFNPSVLVDLSDGDSEDEILKAFKPKKKMPKGKLSPKGRISPTNRSPHSTSGYGPPSMYSQNDPSMLYQ